MNYTILIFILMTKFSGLICQSDFFFKFDNDLLEKEYVQLITKLKSDEIILISTGATQNGQTSPWKQIFRFIDTKTGEQEEKISWGFTSDYSIEPHNYEIINHHGFVLCGSADPNQTPYDREAYLTIHDSTGNLLHSFNYSDSLYQIAAQDICTISGANELAMCGFKLKPMDGSILFGFVFRIDSSGQKVWERDLFGSYSQIKPIGIESDMNGNIYILSEDRSTWPTLRQAAITKYSQNGDSIWTKYYKFDVRCIPKQIQKNKEGNFVVSASIFQADIEQTVPTLFAIDTLGKVLWKEDYYNEIGVSTFAERFTITKDDGYIMSVNDNDGVNEFFTIIRTDKEGQILRHASFKDLGVNYPRDILELDDGSILVTGHINQNTNENYETVWLLKTDSLFNLTTFASNTPSDVIFQISPNPTNQYIEIYLPFIHSELVISISNMKGKTIISKQIDSSITLIDINDIEDGMYFVSLKKGNTLLKTKKVIKTNR